MKDKTRLAIQVFDAFAEAYQDKFMDVGLYRNSLDLFCASIQKEEASVLDIACGPGNLTRYLLNRRPQFRMLGIDLSSKMLDLANANNPEAEFQLRDCREVGKIGRNFDAVLCGFGLPYLSKEEAIQLISDIAGVLNPKGLFYLSTMEGDYAESGFRAPSSGGEEKLFIHYHQADYLTDALGKSGFNILNLMRVKSPESEESSTADLIILAGKSE